LSFPGIASVPLAWRVSLAHCCFQVIMGALGFCASIHLELVMPGLVPGIQCVREDALSAG
jgi:hypothetical protein